MSVLSSKKAILKFHYVCDLLKIININQSHIMVGCLARKKQLKIICLFICKVVSTSIHLEPFKVIYYVYQTTICHVHYVCSIRNNMKTVENLFTLCENIDSNVLCCGKHSLFTQPNLCLPCHNTLCVSLCWAQVCCQQKCKKHFFVLFGNMLDIAI